MKIGRTTTWLFVAVGAVGLYIALVERRPTESPGPGPMPLIQRATERATWFSVSTATSAVECVRRQEGWTLVKPVSARADAAQVSRFLEAMEAVPLGAAITAGERSARGLTLTDYGLAPPRVRISVGDASSRQEVLIGAVSPLGSSLYVKKAGSEDILAVSTNVLSALALGAMEWRDRTVFRGDPRQVTRLEIVRRTGGLLQLARAESGWMIQQPLQCRADERQVSQLIGLVLGIEVADFMSDGRSDPNAYGLGPDDAVLQIAVVLAGEDAPIRLLTGRAVEGGGGQVYARREDSGSVFTVPGDIVARLGVGVADVRDRTVFGLDPAAVTRVRIEEGTRVLALMRLDDGRWKLTDPSEAPADAAAVEALIRRLADLRADGFLDDSETNRMALGLSPPLVSFGLDGLNSGSARVERASAGGGVLRISGQPKDGRVAAWMDGERTAMLVSWPAISGVAVGAVAGARFAVPLAYRDRTILRVNPDGVRMLAVARGGREMAVERASGGAWRAAGDVDRVVNAVAVADILAAVTNLRAVVFEQDRAADLAPYGLREPAVAVTVGLSGPDGIRKRVLIGRMAADGAYACVQGQDVVCVLDRHTVEVLTRDMWVRTEDPRKANGKTE